MREVKVIKDWSALGRIAHHCVYQ